MTQIAFTGHDLDVTDALKELVNSKFEKVQRHFDHVTSAHVTFKVQKVDNTSEITIHVPGHQIHAKATTLDMYKSVDKMMQELDRQVIKHKEKMKQH